MKESGFSVPYWVNRRRGWLEEYGTTCQRPMTVERRHHFHNIRNLTCSYVPAAALMSALLLEERQTCNKSKELLSGVYHVMDNIFISPLSEGYQSVMNSQTGAVIRNSSLLMIHQEMSRWWTDTHLTDELGRSCWTSVQHRWCFKACVAFPPGSGA